MYGNALQNPFHYDDHHSIKYNPHIRSLDNIPRLFSDPQTFSSRQAGYMFRPALLTSYALNYAVGGQSVLGYRAVNLLLHIGCSVAVAALALTLLGDHRQSWFAGLLFLLHPIHTEPINYISSRSDLLVSFAVMVVVVLSVRPRVASWSKYAIYTIGLLTKSVAVVTPFLLLMFDSVWERKLWRGAIRRYWGFVVLTGAYLLAIWANNFLSSSMSGAPRSLDTQLLTQLKAIIYYPFVMLFPAKLSVEHQFSVAPSLELESVFGFFLLVSIVTIVARSRANRLFVLCGGWFVVCLLPASVVPLNVLVSERRVYLASAGLIIAAAWCLGRLSQRAVGRFPLAAALVICAIFVVQRNDVWASEMGLWRDAVSKAPKMHRARINLGLSYLRADMLAESVQELEKGLLIAPDFADGWVVLGEAYQEQGKTMKAVSAFERALTYNPRLAGVYHNLGNLAFARGGIDEAARQFNAALEIDPMFVEARNNLGQTHEAVGEWPAAMVEYERSIADSLYWVNTGDPVGGAWLNLARAAEKLGDRTRAAKAFLRAYQLLSTDPKYGEFAQQALEDSQRVAATRQQNR